MAIKVHFPSGESAVTVRGLYQWDYGQVLEIECNEVGTEILEAHFACPNMSEAIVRTCSFSNGVGSVPIPDECLEQADSVTVWLCKRDSTQRHTIKTIILPLTSRTRPSNMLDDVREAQIDVVGQLIEEINEAVNALEKGNVTASNAKNAEKAGHATIADSASSASYATSAGNAATASRATVATTAESLTSALVASVKITNGSGIIPNTIEGNILYFVVFEAVTSIHSGVFIYNSSASLSECCLGTCQMAFISNFNSNTVSVSSETGTPSNGTLKFYKIGGFA